MNFSSKAKAENIIKQPAVQKAAEMLPNSTKKYNCEKYITIQSDHCRLIKNFFNIVYKND